MILLHHKFFSFFSVFFCVPYGCLWSYCCSFIFFVELTLMTLLSSFSYLPLSRFVIIIIVIFIIIIILLFIIIIIFLTFIFIIIIIIIIF